MVPIDVTPHIRLVGVVARRIARTLPTYIPIDDLIGAGYLGLLDAATRYDAARGPFEAFAEFRIRGAILDELRDRDPLSRDMRRVSNEIRDAAQRLEAQTGHTPGQDDIARALGIRIEELQDRQQKVAGSAAGLDDGSGLSVLDQMADPAATDAFEQTAHHEQITQLMACIERLPEQMHRVLSLYYIRGLTLAQVGVAMGVTESRICQIHGEATKRLRDTCVVFQQYRDRS
jgi:RNA polymerase sigma factor FliA